MRRSFGKPIELGETLAPALFGAALGLVVLALAGIPYLMAPSGAPKPQLGPAATRSALSRSELEVIQQLARARFAGTDSGREMGRSVSWGVKMNVQRVTVFDLEQARISNNAALIDTLRAAAQRSRSVGYEDHAVAAVNWNSSSYAYDRASNTGGKMAATRQERLSYLVFGKKTGRWYAL